MKEKFLYINSIFSISLAASLWGVQGVLLLPMVKVLPVDFVVFFTYGFPFIIMSIFFFSRFKELLRFSKIEHISLIVISLAGVIGAIAIVKALFIISKKDLSIVVIIQKIQPIFAILLAKLILNERAGREFLYWAVFALVGLYIMTFGFTIPEIYGGNNLFLAVLLALISAFFFALNTVLGRLVSLQLDYFTITFYRYGYAALFSFIIMILFSRFNGFLSLNFKNFIILMIIIVISGPISMFLYYFGLKRVKASIAAICELTLPITAIFISYFLYHTHLALSQWLGIAIMLISIYKISIMQPDKI